LVDASTAPYLGPPTAELKAPQKGAMLAPPLDEPKEALWASLWDALLALLMGASLGCQKVPVLADVSVVLLDADSAALSVSQSEVQREGLRVPLSEPPWDSW